METLKLHCIIIPRKMCGHVWSCVFFSVMQRHDQKSLCCMLLGWNTGVVNACILHKEHKLQKTLRRGLFWKKWKINQMKTKVRKRISNASLTRVLQSSIFNTYLALTSATLVSNQWAFAAKKTLRNLTPIATKQDSSWLHGPFAILLQSFLRGKSLHAM